MALCRADTPGAEFFGPMPVSGELVIGKLRYSAFSGDDLDAELTRRGVDTLIVCGLTTDCCVESTARHAFHLDYHVFVAADACAAYEPDLHRAALKSLDLNCAIVVDSDQVQAAWEESGAHGPDAAGR
jgi:ureidoacrylate peracid hydrolase